MFWRFCLILFIGVLLEWKITLGAPTEIGRTKEKGRAYEFGFTIEEQQHRHEKKDENGIVMGEFGFITADGIYHVTVYATDENGKFKIISMKSFPYGNKNPEKKVMIAMLPPAKKPIVKPAVVKAMMPDGKSCGGCVLPKKSNQLPADVMGQKQSDEKAAFRPLSKTFNDMSTNGKKIGKAANVAAKSSPTSSKTSQSTPTSAGTNGKGSSSLPKLPGPQVLVPPSNSQSGVLKQQNMGAISSKATNGNEYQLIKFPTNIKANPTHTSTQTPAQDLSYMSGNNTPNNSTPYSLSNKKIQFSSISDTETLKNISFTALQTEPRIPVNNGSEHRFIKVPTIITKNPIQTLTKVSTVNPFTFILNNKISQSMKEYHLGSNNGTKSTTIQIDKTQQGSITTNPEKITKISKPSSQDNPISVNHTKTPHFKTQSSEVPTIASQGKARELKPAPELVNALNRPSINSISSHAIFNKEFMTTNTPTNFFKFPIHNTNSTPQYLIRSHSKITPTTPFAQTYSIDKSKSITQKEAVQINSRYEYPIQELLLNQTSHANKEHGGSLQNTMFTNSLENSVTPIGGFPYSTITESPKSSVSTIKSSTSSFKIPGQYKKPISQQHGSTNTLTHNAAKSVLKTTPKTFKTLSKTLPDRDSAIQNAKSSSIFPTQTSTLQTSTATHSSEEGLLIITSKPKSIGNNILTQSQLTTKQITLQQIPKEAKKATTNTKFINQQTAAAPSPANLDKPNSSINNAGSADGPKGSNVGASDGGGGGPLYRFKYVLDYNSHREEGRADGAKEGKYNTIDEDGIRRIIDYIANENGYQPHIQLERLPPNELPMGENKLKEYEFVWFN